MTREEKRTFFWGSVEHYWNNEQRPMTDAEKRDYSEKIERLLDEEFGKEPVTG